MRKTLHPTFVITFFFVFFTSTFAYAAPRVVFINPDSEGNAFWDLTTKFIQAAALDLDVQVDTYYANQNRFNALEILKKVVKQTEKPDYLLFIYQLGVGREILELAESSGVKSFIFNTDIYPDDKILVGLPRGKFSQWLGHMYPDDRYAGRILARYLLNKAINANKNPNEIVKMIALSGGRDSSAALERNTGMNDAVNEFGVAQINQMVFAEWSPEIAGEKTRVLLQRYPDTEIIWSASDAMALSAIKEVDLVLHDKTIWTGGIDWTPDALRSIEAGKLSASVGGHFMEGGWALVKLYDYHMGIDFAQEGLQLRSKMQLIDKNNVKTYRERVLARDFKDIDFRQFSKHKSPALKEYDFSLKKVVAALPPAIEGE